MTEPPQDRPQGQPEGRAPGQPYPPQQGRPPQGPGPQGTGPQGYPPQGAGPQGYPQPGRPPQGYPNGAYGPGPQGFAGGPYGPQGGGYGPAGPGGPGGPGGPQPYGRPPQPEQEGPKKRTGLFVLVGAGALALILAVVAVVVNLGGGSDTADGGTGGSTGGGTGSGSSSPAAPAASASDAVSGFLGALAKQDVDTALSYAAEEKVDRALMTPAVLGASAKLAPIKDVVVEPVTDPGATSVPATYKLGSTAVSTTFAVEKVGDAWKLSQVAAPVDVTYARSGSVPMLVNGVKVTKDELTLLPGVYRFSTGQPNYDYGSRPDVVVKSPSETPDAGRLFPGISKKGETSALSAVRKSWSSCLRSKDPKPGGCPNRWTGKYTFSNGTVKWTRQGSDPVKKPRAYPSSSAISYSVKVDLQLKGRCSYQGRTGTCTGTLTGTAVARADVSASKVKVRWQT